MVDILQIETVAASPAPKPSSNAAPNSSTVQAETEEETEEENKEEPVTKPPVTMDSQPTSKNSKFPPLRRAALHFLALLIRANTTRLYNSGDARENVFPTHLVRRVKTTLGYVAATDEDAVVRVMAREALEGLDQMAEATLGI